MIQGNLLDAPKTDKRSEPFYTSTGLCVGSSGVQGWRLEMEDSHIAKDMPSRPDYTLLAVFDGYEMCCICNEISAAYLMT